MKEASKKLDRAQIQKKVMSMTPRQLANQQSTKLETLLERDPHESEKMRYYDILLNLERKCNHFDSLMQKLRLKVVHKPFIILDMLRIIEDDRSPFDIFTSLYARLKSSRKRKAFDSIIRYVEHRNHLADSWLYLAEKLLDREKRRVVKEVRARRKVEDGRREREQLVRRALKFLGSVVGNLRKRNQRAAIAKIKRRSEEDREREKEEEERIREEAKKKLDIAEQEDFFIHKAHAAPKIQIEELPRVVRTDPEKFKLENTNNLLHERRESNNHTQNEIETQSKTSEGEESRRDAINKHRELLSDINGQILEIKARLTHTSSDKLLGLDEEIELLGQLTQLMASLKIYYEFVMENPHFREVRSTRRNFEQMMELIRRIIEKLSERVQRDNQRRRLESNESRDQKQNWASEIEERRSMLLIEDYSKNIQRGMEEMKNLFGESQAEETEQPIPDQQIPDENGINMLLQNMVQNLGQMNHQIEKNVVEEEEESYSDSDREEQPEYVYRNYDSAEEDLFNFFGVLNFQVKKLNQRHLRDAFYKICDSSRDEYCNLLLQSTAQFLFRDSFVWDLSKLSIEVNRRDNLRQQAVFKMMRACGMRLKRVLRVLSLHAQGAQRHRRQPNYSGRCGSVC